MLHTRSRVHLGSGELAAPRELSVFINCPYDSDYVPIFHAVVFATVCCGFVPRCAIESGCTATPRMDRITQAIVASKYSIHDLCRCKGEGDANLARFNMPLELGAAMAQRFGPGGSGNHDWLLLVPRGSDYIRYISDLAGFDPKQHDGSIESVLPGVMSWLATRPDAVLVPTPAEVLAAVPDYEAARAQLDADWNGEATWADTLLTAARVARTAGLIPPVEIASANEAIPSSASAA